MPEHRTLFNFEPPATDAGDPGRFAPVRAEAHRLHKPSQANEAAFERAVDNVAAIARQLMASLVTNAEPRDRAVEAAKARERGRTRVAAGR